MPTFTGQHHATLSLRIPPAQAAAAFADLDRQIACHPELERADKIDATTLRVKMKEMNHGPTRFAGRYTLLFSVDGTTVRWRTGPDSNVDVSGEAVFTAVGTGSRLAYTERVSLAMDLNALLARVLRPIVEAMMGRGMRSFVERMTAELERVGTSAAR
jgi:carbon monoxide dehydrogenase subunit G